MESIELFLTLSFAATVTLSCSEAVKAIETELEMLETN